MRATQVTVGSDRILKVDGRRFFPIGARHIPNGADPKIIRDTGFNCIRWVAFDTDTIASSDINRLIDADIMFYPYISDRGDFAHNKAQKMKDLSSLVDLVKGCPLLLCYEQRNEPTYHYRNWAKLKGSPKGMKEGSDLIRSLDPFHPIRLGHGVCNLVSTIKSFNDSADMIGCNPYVIYDQRMRANCATRMDGRISDSPDQTLSAVGEYTSKMMRAAEGRPVWMQLQACSNEDWYNPDIYTPELKGQGIYPHNRLFPSYYQMRFMAFDAIVRGATAMEWSMYGLSTDDTAWVDVYRIINELSSLHDILASPPADITPDISYVELGFSDWNGVETLIKKHNDRLVMIAVNKQFDPMKAVFSFNMKKSLKRAHFIGKNEMLEITDNSFISFFAPYEVKIFSLEQAKVEDL